MEKTIDSFFGKSSSAVKTKAFMENVSSFENKIEPLTLENTTELQYFISRAVCVGNLPKTRKVEWHRYDPTELLGKSLGRSLSCENFSFSSHSDYGNFELNFHTYSQHSIRMSPEEQAEFAYLFDKFTKDLRGFYLSANIYGEKDPSKRVEHLLMIRPALKFNEIVF